MKHKIYVQDRYSGCYSGFKYLSIEDPFKKLTKEEVEIFNECLKDGDEFYSDWGIDEVTEVTEENTRFEAFDRSFRGADVYAGWSDIILKKIDWLSGQDTLTAIQYKSAIRYN